MWTSGAARSIYNMDSISEVQGSPVLANMTITWLANICSTRVVGAGGQGFGRKSGALERRSGPVAVDIDHVPSNGTASGAHTFKECGASGRTPVSRRSDGPYVAVRASSRMALTTAYRSSTSAGASSPYERFRAL